RFRDAVIRVRNGQKLFQQAGTVTFLGPKLFRAQVDFPAIVPVGVYRVEVYLIRDERVIAAQAIPLFINKTGFEREIFAFAHEHALYYGAASV
ncbi:TIGR02186 family protein, partial [Staphylococcus aureus]